MGNKYTVVLNEYNVAKETITNPAALDRAPHLFDHIPKLGFITANGEEWLEQRRYCLSSTRDSGLGRNTWEELAADEASRFTQYLKGEDPKEISHELAASLTSNIISLLLGRRLTDKEKIQLSVDYADVSFVYMGPSDPTSLIPGLRKVLEVFRIGGYREVAHIIRQFEFFVKEEVAKHQTLKEFKVYRDFINNYLEKMAELKNTKNHYFTESNLEGNLQILFLAASDTIFSSLTWVLRLMAKHKDVQSKVRAEVNHVLGKEGLARYAERHKVPYTFAVLMEAARYASIVPLSTTRSANRDFTINGYTIPKGTEIFANLWALHHDPNYWKEPELFVPERFLSQDGTTLVKNPPSFAPFSLGRRNCPGETIAWMELLIYFTEIVKRFEISTPPGVEPEFEEINGLVARLKPQALVFEELSI